MRPLKRLTLALALSTALATSTVTPARAEPISTALVILNALAGQALIAAGASFATASTILSIAGSVATAAFSASIGFAANAAFAPDAPSVPPSETTGNFFQEAPSRYLIAGRWRRGGSISFCATLDGRIYKQIAHSDTELIKTFAYYLNDVKADMEGASVTNEEFTDDGSRYYALTSRTGVAGQLVQPNLLSLFSEWTNDHVGAGIADTLMRVGRVGAHAQGRVRRFQGALGLGEPDIDLAGRWGRYHDPRLAGSDPADPSTWGPNMGNPALTWAWHRTDPERFAMRPEDIDWQDVAEQADICDAPIIDRYGDTAPHFECAIAIDKAKERKIDSEDRILASCDGIVIEGDDGRLSLRVGVWEEPTLVLTNENIIDLDCSARGTDEESPSHFFANYTEPAFGYVGTTCAEWVSPNWTPDQRINKVSASFYTCPNHRQAVELSAQAARRDLEPRKLSILADKTALAARGERFLRLDLGDDPYSGTYEIVSAGNPGDNDDVPLSLIRSGPGSFGLSPGEEGARPNFDAEITTGANLTNIDSGDMTIVARETGSGVQLHATFVPPEREDVLVAMEYRVAGAATWADFSVNTEAGEGETGDLTAGAAYEARWRTVTLGGAASPWFDPPRTITAVGDPTPPDALASAFAVGGLGTLRARCVTPSTGTVPKRIAIYANRTGMLDREADGIVTLPVSAGQTVAHDYGDTGATDLVTGGGFDVPGDWTAGGTWTVTSGEAVKTPGTADDLTQTLTLADPTATVRYAFDVTARAAGGVQFGLFDTSDALGGAVTATGNHSGAVIADGHAAFGLRSDGAFDGTIDTMQAFEQRAGSIAQGDWFVWIEPQNGSGVAGPLEGPFTVPVV